MWHLSQLLTMWQQTWYIIYPVRNFPIQDSKELFICFDLYFPWNKIWHPEKCFLLDYLFFVYFKFWIWVCFANLILWIRQKPMMWRCYVTMTWGADTSRRMVAITVNNVKIIRHSLSSTMAANFQSHSVVPASSSFRIFSVITLSSFRMRVSSRTQPDGSGVIFSSK